MKENDPGCQAPSTRQGQGGQQRDKQMAYSPHPGLLSLSLSLSNARTHTLFTLLVCLYLVQNLGCKTVGILNDLSQCYQSHDPTFNSI